MTTLTIRKPDDFHVHLRQGWTLKQVLPATARVFGRALVMPNTEPPVLDWNGVCGSFFEIQDLAAKSGCDGFYPMMTIQITAGTTIQTIRECAAPPCFAGKLYPAGVTTNSGNGVTDLKALYPVFGEMEAHGMVLCLHGETPDAFCLEREWIFLDALIMLAADFPKLRVVLEHVSTVDAVSLIRDLPDTFAATITAHHLVLTLDDVIGDKFQPHHFCKPLPKTREDRDALIEAATSGDPKFFFGSDSAPHRAPAKECCEGAAGVFSAPAALPVLAEVFEREGKLDRLEGFVSEHGARFYGLPLNEGTVTLERKEWRVPRRYCDEFVPFMAERVLEWRLADQ